MRTSDVGGGSPIRRALAILSVLAVPLVAIGGGPPPAAAAPGALRVYVLVTDGLGPEEVTEATMPQLTRLKADGTWYSQARSVLVAETLPNHVAMATGVVPARNGIVANSAFDPARPGQGDAELSEPTMLTAETTTTRLERECPQVATATIMSKTYLYDIFAGGRRNIQADLHWNAEPLYIPGSNHTADQLTMDRLRRWVFVEQPDVPQYAFVNLGDIDRSGHLDPTGGGTGGAFPAGRRGAMADTDTLIGEFAEQLKVRGLWDESVLIVASDHAMDFSGPQDYVDVRAPLEAAGLRVGFDPKSDDVGISENGGAALVYVHDERKRATVRGILSSLAGVDRVLARGSGEYARYGLDHRRSGDFLVLVEEGLRVASGDLGSSNPLPGNHGHAVTQHSVLLAVGGHAVLSEPRAVDGPTVYRPGMPPRPPQAGPGNLSIAPTVAHLFGVTEPSGGYSGKVLDEALDATAPPQPCAERPAQPVDGARDDRPGGRADRSPPGAGDAAGAGVSLPATGGTTALALGTLLAGVGLAAWVRRRHGAA